MKSPEAGVLGAGVAASGGRRADDGQWLVRAALFLTVGLLVARLLTIGGFGFFADESYYWLWSQNLAFGYYDHPPMVAYFIRAGTLLFGDNEFGVRFVGTVSVVADVALIYGITLVLTGSRRVAAIAAIFANLTFLAALSVIIVPDHALILFWLAAFYGLARIAKGGSGRWWLLVGAAFGLAATSKYTAFFMAAAVPVWLALVPDLRKWFRSPWPFVGAAIALLIFLPVLLWNADAGWPSVAIQVDRDKFPARLGGLLTYLEMLAIAVTPFFAILTIAGVVQCLRPGWTKDAGRALLLIAPLPLLLYLAYHSLRERTEPHWLSPFVFMAAIFAALPFEGAGRGVGRRVLAWIGGAGVAFGALFTLGFYALLLQLWLPFTLAGDLTGRFRAWPEFAATVEAKAEEEGAGYVVAPTYGMASQLRFYMRGSDLPVYELGEWERGVFGTADPSLATAAGLFIGDQGRRAADQRIAETYFGDVSFTGPVTRVEPGGKEVSVNTFLLREPTPAAAPLFGGEAPIPSAGAAN